MVNTYNDPDNCDLSQTLQYHKVWADTDDDYSPTHLVVHVHGGCDVRGGYTAPKCFRLNAHDDYAYLDAMRFSGVAAGDNTWWRSGWRDLEACSQNECDLDLFEIPVFLLDDAPVSALAEEHEWFIACKGGKAWLFDSKARAEADGLELTVFSDLV